MRISLYASFDENYRRGALTEATETARRAERLVQRMHLVDACLALLNVFGKASHFEVRYDQTNRHVHVDKVFDADAVLLYQSAGAVDDLYLRMGVVADEILTAIDWGLQGADHETARGIKVYQVPIRYTLCPPSDETDEDSEPLTPVDDGSGDEPMVETELPPIGTPADPTAHQHMLCPLGSHVADMSHPAFESHQETTENGTPACNTCDKPVFYCKVLDSLCREPYSHVYESDEKACPTSK